VGEQDRAVEGGGHPALAVLGGHDRLEGADRDLDLVRVGCLVVISCSHRPGFMMAAHQQVVALRSRPSRSPS
jgi:hypothetical protein